MCADSLQANVDLSLLDIEEIVRSCSRESEHYFRGQPTDTRYCFELFRRAFVNQDNLAWEHIFKIYRPLVSRWINNHPAFEQSGEETDYFINRAFEKIWSSINPAKFSKFTQLSALLSYLKMCVGSVLLDHVRAAEKSQFESLEENSLLETQDRGPSVSHQVIEQLESKKLWQSLKDYLTDPHEYLVVYACFVLDMKPKEILAQFPGNFDDIREVYRVKENVLNKLRENTVLFRFLGETSGEKV